MEKILSWSLGQESSTKGAINLPASAALITDDDIIFLL
jgi:hypothetical protein